MAKKKKAAKKSTKSHKLADGLAIISRKGKRIATFLTFEDLPFIAKLLGQSLESLEYEILDGDLGTIGRTILTADTMYQARQEIVDNMAKAFFANAWASGEEELGGGIGGGVEIMDVMPAEIDPEAMEMARRLANEMEAENEMSLLSMLRLAEELSEISPGDRAPTAEMFGHYAAMQSMGTGVGLESLANNLDNEIEVPYHEFSFFNLKTWPDYWRTEDEDEG